MSLSTTPRATLSYHRYRPGKFWSFQNSPILVSHLIQTYSKDYQVANADSEDLQQNLIVAKKWVVPLI